MHVQRIKDIILKKKVNLKVIKLKIHQKLLKNKYLLDQPNPSTNKNKYFTFI